MVRPRVAVHRTILVVDVERFGDRRRTNRHQVAVRDGMYHAVRHGFRCAGISWSECDHEDRGDGVFVLAPASTPKCSFVEALPDALAEALRSHNKEHCAEERIRLRMVLHAGEIHYDDHGATGTAINLAFRLLEAEPLKAALAESTGVLALITSSWFYEEVVRHSTTLPAAYRPAQVSIKETDTTAWICLPDHCGGTPETEHLARANGPRAPRQLPPSTPHFVGRTDELDQLATVAANSHTVVITAIIGTAGVGKTALALHWAHRAADHFPDGQLYVNLQGFDPTESPLSPAEALRRLLNAFHTAPERIPADFAGQVALYRRLMADRKSVV